MVVRSWDDYTQKLLLQGRWLPVTGRLLFINASAAQCSDALLFGVRGQYIKEHYGYPLSSRRVDGGSLSGLLGHLLPLENPVNRRTLLLQTANAEWTAMFTAARGGTDPSSAMAWFGENRIATMTVIDIPHMPTRVGGYGAYGSRMIQMYEIPPEGEPIGHALGVRAANLRKWDWVHYPDNPFPGGSVSDPDAKRVTDRFTHEHLVQMAGSYGLRPMDEDFYAPDGTGILIERTDPIPPGWKTYTLAQARGEEPRDD